MEDNVEWLIADFSIRCYTTEHYKFMYGIALPSILLWCLAAPIFLGVWIMRYAKKEVEQYLNFFTAGYRFQYKNWELCGLIKKYLLIASVTFLARYNTDSQLLTGLFVLNLHLSLQGYFWPMKATSQNVLEFICSLASFASLSAAQLYYTGLADDRAVTYFMLSLLGIFNLGYLLYAIKCLLKPQVLQTFRDTSNRSILYLADINSVGPTARTNKTYKTVDWSSNISVPANSLAQTPKEQLNS